MADVWLTVDPGEDTGWSLWSDKKLVEAGTTKLWHFADDVWDAIEKQGYLTEDGELIGPITRIVCEDFRLYPWKLKDLAWDQVRTARLIGALTFMSRLKGLDFVLQPAAIKERSQAAGARELFLTPLKENRHANDAIMHGVYYLAVQAGVRAVDENRKEGEDE